LDGALVEGDTKESEISRGMRKLQVLKAGRLVSAAASSATIIVVIEHEE